jgi:hypothetical protein
MNNDITSLDGMTYEKWQFLPHEKRQALRDNSCLSPQLTGLEGWRVEVVSTCGEKRRFIVGKSTGWRPVHLELYNRRSISGGSADREYLSVKKLYISK